MISDLISYQYINISCAKVEENPEFAAVDPELLDEAEEERARVTDFGRIVVPDRNVLKEKTSGLDNDQRKVLDITVKFARDILKARSKGRALPDPPHMMVHGTAGTGITRLFGYTQISHILKS